MCELIIVNNVKKIVIYSRMPRNQHYEHIDLRKNFLVAAIWKFKMEALDVNGKTGTHFFLDQ